MKIKSKVIPVVLGVIAGLILGLNLAFFLFRSYELHIASNSDHGETFLGICVLTKLSENDVEGAKEVISTLLANNYIFHTKNSDSWKVGTFYQNENLIELIESAEQKFPCLENEIQKQKTIGIGLPIAEEPSLITVRTDRVYGDSAVTDGVSSKAD